MKIIKVLLCMIVVFLLFPNCATIMSTRDYPLTVNSTPNGASVVITDNDGTKVFVGTTPAILYLRAGGGFFMMQHYKVKLTMPGYEEMLIPVNCSINGWYVGNVLLLIPGLIPGLIGLLIVDPATGAMYKLETNTINETLEMRTTLNQPMLKILDIRDLSPDLKKHLICINKPKP